MEHAAVGGARPAQSMERGTLGLGLMTSPTLGAELMLKKKKKKIQTTYRNT